MGSEQSTQAAGVQRHTSLKTQTNKNVNLRKQHTIASSQVESEKESCDIDRTGSSSPGPSVCSDSDLPYISYTVNRPIGDSPKVVNKQQKSSSSRKAQQKLPKSAHNIVVVKPALCGPDVDSDSDILRLQKLPMFLPIMRGSINLTQARDPEVLERLDPGPFRRLCAKYQNYLAATAAVVASEQNRLTGRIKEIDGDIAKLLSTAVERQKRFAKYAENLAKVQELSKCLSRCHTTLNQTLESMETLNNQLSIEHRLEPFVWTTG